MRTGASESGFLVPEFCGVCNYDELRAYMGECRPLAVEAARGSLGAGDSQNSRAGATVARAGRTGRRAEPFLLEQFVPGDIFHVDSIVSESKVVFSGGSSIWPAADAGDARGRRVHHADGGSRAAGTGGIDALNAELAPSLGMVRGVTHAEYIRAHADGRYYFLEIAARVGGAFIADLVEMATGINLWREWARLEVANLRGETYSAARARLRATRAACFAWPRPPSRTPRDFDAPEIVVRMKKHHHAGLIVRSESRSG